LTRDIEPIPGRFKERYEDFFVEEIPAYPPCGEGDHLYLEIEKRGLSTARAVRDIARALGIKPRNVGVAGQKDARAVTRQRISVERVPAARAEALEIPRIRVLSAVRHRNKLKIGHLRGNRFVIRLRETPSDRVLDIRRILEILVDRGAPNYFGEQRFGARGDTGEIGAALLSGDHGGAARLIAGAPGDRDEGAVAEARRLFDAGRFDDAARAWPRGFAESVAVCRAMARFDGDARRAALALDKRTLGFYVSAWQSGLFNRVVAARIDALHRVREGDVACKHENGASFLVEDPAAEQPRADLFEISPTGPLFGKRLKPAAGRVAADEAALLEGAGLRLEELPTSGPLRCTGGRRPLRFRPTDPEVAVDRDDDGDFVKIGFSLPTGCYATAVLREILKA